MKNDFRTIPGYEDYEVNSEGVVRSKSRFIEGRFGTTFIKGRIKKLYLCPNGYMQTCLSKNKKGASVTVHRLAALAFIPNPHNKPFVNHINNNRSDNNVSNLEWCTALENTRHSIATGTFKYQGYGEDNTCAKLTTAQVLEIRAATGLQSQIAQRYQINQATVSDIKRRKRWPHL